MAEPDHTPDPTPEDAAKSDTADVIYRDVTGRDIRVGDLLQVLHFRTKRKIYWMYFLVFNLGGRLRCVHTHLIPTKGLTLESSLPIDVVCKSEPRIVCGYACHRLEVSYEDRPRVKDVRP